MAFFATFNAHLGNQLNPLEQLVVVLGFDDTEKPLKFKPRNSEILANPKQVSKKILS